MKCSMMLLFIWVFTVCKSSRLGVSGSGLQRVNSLGGGGGGVEFSNLIWGVILRINPATYEYDMIIKFWVNYKGCKGN